MKARLAASENPSMNLSRVMPRRGGRALVGEKMLPVFPFCAYRYLFYPPPPSARSLGRRAAEALGLRSHGPRCVPSRVAVGVARLVGALGPREWGRTLAGRCLRHRGSWPASRAPVLPAGISGAKGGAKVLAGDASTLRTGRTASGAPCWAFAAHARVVPGGWPRAL